MPRFVLLRHDMPPAAPKPSHWDLMLERNGVLLTWSMLELPGAWRQALGAATTDPDWASASDVGDDAASDEISAQRLEDHRIDYLDYEGPVSGNRGAVRRCDRGEYQLVAEVADALTVDLQGEIFQGRIELAAAGDRDSVVNRWTLRVGLAGE